MSEKPARAPGIFLVDVDETLIDDDRIQNDLREHLERHFGENCRDRYFAIFERLHSSLGYCDYLGALQRYRIEYPHESHVLLVSSYLMDYPFNERLHPRAMDVLGRLRSLGPTVIVSDGDAVFQPRKIERSGIHAAVDGHVLIYIHKEDSLADVEKHYPARHYVLIDHQPRILGTVRDIWYDRVTTVLVRKGPSGRGISDVDAYTPPDVTVENVGELLDYDLGSLLAKRELEVAQ